MMCAKHARKDVTISLIYRDCCQSLESVMNIHVMFVEDAKPLHLHATPSPLTCTPMDAASYPYAALDLGTNNCRLLVAVPTPRRFRVIDSFSQIVRLGEGVTHSGQLSEV